MNWIKAKAELQKATTAEEAGDLICAIGHAKTVVQLKPQEPTLWMILGNLQRHAELFAAATTSYEHCLRLDPTFARAHVGIGLAHRSLGDMTAATASFRKSLQLRDCALTRVHLGDALLWAGESEEAKEHLQAALAEEPDNADAMLCLGIIHSSVDRDAARTYLEAARGDGASEFRASLELAYLCWEQGEFDTAEALLTRAVEIKPEDAMASAYLGLVQHSLGNSSAASDWLARARSSAILKPAVYVELAFIHEVAERPKIARELLAMATELDPADADTQEALSEFLGRNPEGSGR
jgi:tetratricopeptide (TPR) repeat protein